MKRIKWLFFDFGTTLSDETKAYEHRIREAIEGTDITFEQFQKKWSRGEIMVRSYEHMVQYYETDKMGITHHSNYIRWMEEARVDFLEQIGWGFDKLEAQGIVSPVVAVECQYKATTTFPEIIRISVSIEEFKGVKLKLKYSMVNSGEKVVCVGRSEHCFLNMDGRPVKLNKEFPDLYKELTELAEA